jgi:hypothetical protein
MARTVEELLDAAAAVLAPVEDARRRLAVGADWLDSLEARRSQRGRGGGRGREAEQAPGFCLHRCAGESFIGRMASRSLACAGRTS